MRVAILSTSPWPGPDRGGWWRWLAGGRRLPSAHACTAGQRPGPLRRGDSPAWAELKGAHPAVGSGYEREGNDRLRRALRDAGTGEQANPYFDRPSTCSGASVKPAPSRDSAGGSHRGGVCHGPASIAGGPRRGPRWWRSVVRAIR